MTIRRYAIVVFAAAAMLPAAAAQAQWYSSAPAQPPLYPYGAPAQQPYAVQVAPNTFVIHRPNEAQSAPRHRAQPRKLAVAAAPAAKRRHSKIDPALIEELRKRPRVEPPVVNTTQIVQEKPIVRETTRYVDDPPRVVERRHYADGEPAPTNEKRLKTAEAAAGARVIRRRGGNHGGQIGDGEKRVISADAEITILGPDRMSIQLFRKGNRAKAEALPSED
jgi:hypothetical protein